MIFYVPDIMLMKNVAKIIVFSWSFFPNIRSSCYYNRCLVSDGKRSLQLELAPLGTGIPFQTDFIGCWRYIIIIVSKKLELQI